MFKLLPTLWFAILPCIALAAEPATQPAATPLPTDALARQSVVADHPELFSFEATEAGVLTVVARPLNEAALSIAIFDEYGRYITGTDTYEDAQCVATLPAAGRYNVQIAVEDGSCRYRLLAHFAAVPAPMNSKAATKPETLTLGQKQEIKVGREEESRWYAIEPTEPGILTIYTTIPDEDDEADVTLEISRPNTLQDNMSLYVDEDRPHPGTEVISVHVEPEEPLLLEVGFYEGTYQIDLNTQFTPLDR